MPASAARHQHALLLAALMVLTSLTGLVLPTRPVAAAPRPVPAPLQVRITPSGFVPSSVTLAAGQTLWVDNQTTGPQTFTTADGWADSGDIPAGGRFVLATAPGAIGRHG